MDLIFTNKNHEDMGVLQDFDLDLAFGADENDFECSVPAASHCCEAGSLLYMEGTEYGGIVDTIESDTEAKEVKYKGRTWHGILGSKVIEPLKEGEAKKKIVYKDNFSDNDWETIIDACRTNNVPETWDVGDQKAMTINGTDYLVDIIGKNHDIYSDGSGFAPLTFQLNGCYGTKYPMNSTATNSGGWESSVMRKTTLPGILGLMPSAVQEAIKAVNKLSSAGSGSGAIITTADKLFLLSEVEIFGKTTYSHAGEGTQYAYYKNGNSTIKTLNGSADHWWERSPYTGNTASFCMVYNAGTANTNTATYSRGVSFAFCFACDTSSEDETTSGESTGSGVTIYGEDSDGNSLVGKYLVISGDANDCINFILDRIGLSSLMCASEETAGVDIQEYQFNRFTDAYSGLTGMLASAGQKLHTEVHDGQVVLSSEAVVDYTADEEFDSDLVDFVAIKKFNAVNHLICLGAGELENRTVIHLYADKDGNISQEQTQEGLDEVVAVYEDTSAEAEELIPKGTEELLKLWEPDKLKVDFDDSTDSYDVGDIVGAYDNITGISVAAVITKKIVTIKNGQVNISYKVGE